MKKQFNMMNIYVRNLLSIGYNVVVCLVMMCFTWTSSFAQQPFTYTHYNVDMTPYNTSYSLLQDEAYLNVLGRKQWAGINGAPTTFLLSVGTPISRVGASTGVVVSHRQLGIEKQSEAGAFFAKSIRLSNKTYLGASLNGGIRHYQAAFSSLDGNDPKFRDDIVETNTIVGASLMLYDPELFYVGVSLPHLSLRSVTESPSPEQLRSVGNTWYISGGLSLSLGEIFTLKPATLITYTKNLPLLLDFSTMLYLDNAIGVGVNVRSTKEFAGLVNLGLGDKTMIGYSYQSLLGAKKTGRLANATHEIFLGFKLGSKK